MHILKYAALAFLLVFTVAIASAQAQSRRDTLQLPNSPRKISADSIIANPESKLFEGDSLASGIKGLPFQSQQDSIATPTDRQIADSIRYNQPIGDIVTTINYSARDSIYFEIKKQKVLMYGNANIDYGDINLEADKIEINWIQHTIDADYTADSTGRKIGKPIFTEKGQSYETDEMTYNFQTRRAYISGIITQQGDAFVQGERVRKNEENELFIRNAKYTTCNLANPHFHIASSKLKAIPGNKVISGPFNLAFREITTPLGFFFGMFPQPKKKTSGVVVPSYGEERRRGFFLRDGGYYFALSEYADLRLTGDIYSKGGYSLNINNNYKKRYAYNGNMRFSYNRFLSDEPDNNLDSKDFSLSWSHTPESKGTSRFSSSVNIRTNSYNQNNNMVQRDFNQSVSAQFSSNVTYNKTFKGTPFNLTAAARHNQNVQTKVLTVTAPEITYSMNRINPFKNVKGLRDGVLGKLNLSHNFTAKNDISNGSLRRPSNFNVLGWSPRNDSILAFNSENLSQIFDRAIIGGRHNIPISTSFNLLKHLVVSPSVQYTELWYTKQLNYTWVPEQNGMRVDTLNRFSRAYTYTVGSLFNTRLYGMVYFSKGNIKAIRHVLTPQVGFNYSPDFRSSRFGYFQDVQINERGQRQLLSRYEGLGLGNPGGAESAVLSFTLNNNVEMKVADKKELEKNPNATKKVKIFENLAFGSGYNILADSFKLQPISFNTRTSFINNLINVNFTGGIDPYRYLLDSVVETATQRRVFQRRVDEYAWNSGNGLGKVETMNIAMSFRLAPDVFKPDAKKSAATPQGDRELTFQEEQELLHIRDNPDLYLDFSIPWSLSTNYTVGRKQSGFADAQITQSLSFNGDISLTEKTKITFRSGYDFTRKEFSQTSIDVVRDLHCWTMRLNWVPFGRFQSFNFTINAKSSLLQDLKFEKRNAFQDNLR